MTRSHVLAVTLAVVSTVPLTARSDGADGGLDGSEVARVVRAHTPAIRACYERALRQNVRLGRLADFRFTVLGNGRVRDVHLRFEPRARDTEACVMAVVQRMVFPPFQGAPVTITMPMNVDVSP